ncbi:amino acid adenylation domain-containing protein [Variovorax sp. J22P271]|uniref:non-ribosomal peptide synthetase n=1 Tax=Variovorax davisae TaxID=3053515 RepID=UPI002575DC51|nr:non-ribosomal peptide synthetase [Variovorax sp. J22P271]MDM0034717.1 amino acid adenylation domain-containing protein [Variovorax sp. J22P271]
MIEHSAATLHAQLALHALVQPLATALLSPGQRAIGYAELFAIVRGLRSWLAGHGLSPASRIAVVMPSGIESAVATLAIGAQATCIPLPAGLPEPELLALLADARADAVVGLPGDAMASGLARTLNRVALDFDLPHWRAGAVEEAADLHAPWPEPSHTAFVLFTSGTTGKAKRVPLGQRQVVSSARSIARHLALAPADRALCVMPIHHSHGLVGGLLAPLVAGSSVVCAPAFDAPAFMGWMAEFEPTWYTAAPTVHHAIADQASREGMAAPAHALRLIRSASSPMPVALLQHVEDLWGVPVIESYGMTESATQLASNALPPAPRKPGSVGRPVGAELRVVDVHGHGLPVGQVGAVVARGPALFEGYEDNPEANAEAFRDGWFITGDLGRFDADGDLFLTGRSKEMINRGGEKISPFDVEQALLRLPGVAQAVAYPAPHPTLGEDVHAIVVAAAGRSIEGQALRAALFGQVADFKIPARIRVLATIPVGPGGKVRRRDMHGRTARLEAEEIDRLAPRSTAESILMDIWQAVLGRSGFGIRSNFFELGGHSLSATQIVSRIGAALKIELPVRSVLEHPTIESLARAIEARRPDLSGGAARGHDPIVPVPREQPLPVSFSQRNMWMFHDMDPHGAAYHVRKALRLRGSLQAAALREALDTLVARHEAFRTTFAMGEAEPMATVGPVQPANLVGLDLRAIPGPERDTELERQAARLAAEPFDLGHGPLHRFILVELGAQDHALVLVLHHLIGDDWSWGVLLRDLEAMYNAACTGAPAPAPAPAPRPSIDFVDYASWQRGHADDEALAGDTAYWLQQLAGMSPLNLVADSAVTRRRTSRGEHVRRLIPDDWMQEVHRFSGRLGLTPFMTLLAAFQVLLARQCAQQDIVVGTPIAGRTRIEAEALVGSLVNTLMLRSDVQPAMNFRELACQVRETCLSAFTHQHAPFDHVVDSLRRNNSGGRVPEVRAMFNVLNTPRQLPRLEGLEASFMPLGLGATQFDLALTIETEDERSLALNYSTELFAPATAKALLDGYLHLLDRLMQDPERPLHELAAADPLELARLATWNQTASAYPRAMTVHGLLAEQRAAGGTAILQLPGDALGYPELWSRVHRLAHALRQQGVQRGCRVGLCLERGPTMVVAQLAILAAGAAYVPLDPAYPRLRLLDMALDAGLSLLMSPQEMAEWWREHGLPTLVPDAEDAAWMAQPDTPLPPDAERDAGAGDAAYMIYTSGSTGKPKGVVVPHRAVVNFLLSMQREPGLTAQDAVLAVTTLSFDIAVLELLLPLAIGATVVLATREQATDGVALGQLIERSRASVMQATPASWRMLIDAGWRGSPTFKALVGGESLNPSLARELLQRSGELWNMYGPTETTVWSTCWKVQPEAQAISIGRPIANTRIHVLDAQDRPCPPGVSGEIFIGGDGVTLGYWNRPELSAERFIADPFDADPQARLYRTGDRGRWRHDGLIEHQGRLDFQVKVRGHRIEPGEIEARLLAHPSVAQCLVTAREDRPGDIRLVAYVVPRDGALDPLALKDHLRPWLPGYMLPQHYVALAALPLLPNGKIDRHALPAPKAEDRSAAKRGDEPATPAEVALSGVWGGVLGLAPFEIARSDNFFDLGGDSLQAGRVAIEFQRLGGVRLEPRRLLFESLAQLAAGAAIPAPASALASHAQPRPYRTRRRLFKQLFKGWLP